MRTKSFCNYCNSSLKIEFLEGKERQVCKNCGQVYYENPLPVASVIVSNERHDLLLVKRGNEPFKGMWCFPIGFAETGESIEHAAIRELKEEAGIDGRITQLIDVDSHKNRVYGELLIVTFEAEKTGGNERAGDDASDYGYFPATNLPKLAFDSQEKSLKKYIQLKQDIWNMHDSFEKFVEETVKKESFATGDLLSDELIDVIEQNANRIVDLWLSDISTNPSTRTCRLFEKKKLLSRGMFIMTHFKEWLRERRSEIEFKTFYIDFGGSIKREGMPLEEMISVLSILKKHIFRFAASRGLWYRPLEIYQVFELGERLVYFFDRAVYYSVVGHTNQNNS